MKPRFILLILILGLAIRLLVFNLPPFTFDMQCWINWSNSLARVGPGQFYALNWSDYLPTYLYVLWFFGVVHNLIPQFPQIYLMKIPAVISDLAIGWIIYKLVREKRSAREALLAASFFIFSPFVIFNSSIWGQVDAVLSLILVGSVYFLVTNKEGPAFILLGLAFLFKPQALFFLPLYVLFISHNSRNSGRLISQEKSLLIPGIFNKLILFVGTIFLVGLPFFMNDPFFGLPKMINRSANTYEILSANAMNLWGIFGTWATDKANFLSLSFEVWGLLFLSLGLGFAWLSFLIRKDKDSIFLAASLIVLAYFTLPTRVHDRWLFPFFPFFLVWSARNNFRIISVYLIFSLLHFFNLYFGYTYFNTNFLKINEISQFLSLNFKWFSLVLVLGYGLLCFYTFWFLMCRNPLKSKL